MRVLSGLSETVIERFQYELILMQLRMEPVLRFGTFIRRWQNRTQLRQPACDSVSELERAFEVIKTKEALEYFRDACGYKPPLLPWLQHLWFGFKLSVYLTWTLITGLAVKPLWWGLRHFCVWFVTRSPLAEPQRSARHSVLRLIPWVLVAAGWAVLTMATIIAFYAATLPDPRQAGIIKTPPHLTILARNGEYIAERGMRREYVHYQDIPQHLVNALIVTEDRRFFDHVGVDPVGLARAVRTNYKSGEIQQGGSSITQQLAKNLYLGPERTWKRKVEEFILTLWLEYRFSKQEILELYLNRVYFGAGNYGIGAACHYYFQKEPKDITLSEAALLAGLIKAPSHYSPLSNIERAKERAREILRKLAETDKIDINQYAEALANPPQIQVAPSAPGFGYVADWVTEVAPMLTSETDRNLIVETTIDADLQLTARDAVENMLKSKGSAAHASEAAAMLMTPDGAIRAMVGGRDHATSQFNRAVYAKRQPGSSFKPFVYLAAIENGLTPDTKVEDSPIEIDGWKPENFSRTFHGEMTLRDALTHSSNLAAVRLMQTVGTERIVEVAHRMGVNSARDVGPTLALGTSEVTLMEMTSAFAVFSNGGTAVIPEIVERIRDDQGHILFERAKAPRPQIVSLRAVSAMNDMMNSVFTDGTARGASLPLHPAAGKTGTSQNFKDAWIVAYTSYWVGGVWVGNDASTPMKGVTGGSLPAEVWREIMMKAHEGLMTKALPGTELNNAFIATAADELGLSTLPAHNPFRETGKNF